MSVLDPAELGASPLADLHLLANELGVDGFRRLRKAQLVDAILVAQGGEPASADAAAPAEDAVEDAAEAPGRPARRARSGRARSRSRQAEEETEVATAAGDEAEAVEEEDRPRRRTRGGRGRARDADRDAGAAPAADTAAPAVPAAPAARDDEPTVEGLVDIVPNGSAFIRLSPPEPGDDDVYISAAQVKRCELVSGDRVAGPVRPPRRSERYPSLIRVDTINGRSADEVAGEGTRYEDLSCAFPTERFELGGDDATVKAIEWLTPFGRGSRVSVVGPSQSGKTEALLRLAAALNEQEGLEVSVALVGARPEELAVWTEAGVAPAVAAVLGTSAESQALAVEQAVEQSRRIAARGGDAVVVIDALDGVTPAVAQRAISAARNLVDGGSLTVLAGSAQPVGGETTLIALDPALTGARSFPAVDLTRSGTLRPELLVGDAGSVAIAKARAKAER